MQTQLRTDKRGTKTGTVDDAAVGALEQQLRGRLIRQGDPDYDEVRQLYNGMIDKHPAVIARCVDEADVMAAVDFARQQDVLVAVRGGGHSAAGLGSCDGGLMIDLSPMRGIRVDPDARTVLVQGGCVLVDVDHATHAYGLAVPSGVFGTTGVAGLTLGGGHGYLSRKYGLTIDNLLAADVVLADGHRVTASEKQHPDLFWALRGGGGNFGVVTAFHFRAQPVSTIIGGPTFWPLERSADVLRWYREFLPQAPEDLYGFFAFLTVPPVALFPEELHLQKMCGIIWCYIGPPERADEVFKPVRAFGPPALDGIHEMPFPMLQSVFDALHPPGLQWYWKGDFVNEISDEAIARHVEHARKMPTPESTMHLYPIDGAVNRVGPNETAFSYRDATWSMIMVGVDPDPANADSLKDWVRNYWDDLHPYSAGGAYLNFMMDEGQERIQATYRDNYPRLVEVKNRYDPTNLFRVNQNIQPTR